MSPLDEETIRRKLTVITENLQALLPIMDLTRDEYATDLYRRKATERLLQELVEAAIDVNIHLIVQTGHPAPDDYYDSFMGVGELKVIPMNLAEKMAPSAGLRNRLVHQYDRLNHAIVHQAVRMAEELYPAYVSKVEEFITKNSTR
jgi:uncharacterized protein YutE (UPF0331/DUF86 family)